MILVCVSYLRRVKKKTHKIRFHLVSLFKSYIETGTKNVLYPHSTMHGSSTFPHYSDYKILDGLQDVLGRNKSGKNWICVEMSLSSAFTLSKKEQTTEGERKDTKKLHS